MNWTEMYGPDEDGWYDVACKKCKNVEFTVMGNEDGETMKILCNWCKNEVAVHLAPYKEDLDDNGFGEG